MPALNAQYTEKFMCVTALVTDKTLVIERYFAFASHQTDHMRVREALAVWFELDRT